MNPPPSAAASPVLDPPVASSGEAADGPRRLPWTASAEAVVAAFGVDPEVGLDADEASRRLDHHGPNRLAEPPPRPRWRLFLEQFQNLLIVVLMGAAVLAGLVGDWKDTIVIGVVLLINATLGFLQENRAERSLAALREMLVLRCRVRREGQVLDVAADEVVPGDVVLLEAGDKVPADGRLVRAASLEIDESALTGESVPVVKEVGSLAAAGTPLAERSSMVHLNSVVTRGRGELVVTGTGMDTEMGRLADLLAEAEPGPTPLQIQLDSLGKRLAVLAVVAVVLFAGLNLLRGEPLGEVLLNSVAVLVASIPEGLPAVVTLTLAVSVFQLSKRGAIVKRLASVETLGSTSVICTDKTGTLTLNQMTARRVVVGGQRFGVTGEGYRAEGTVAPLDDGDPDVLERALKAMALCNDSSIRDGVLIGDPTEGGLLALATKGGVDVGAVRSDHPRVAEVPFDPAVKLMATWNSAPDGSLELWAKGAPDILLERCTTLTTGDGRAALDATAREALGSEIEAMAREGLRVLAVAVAPALEPVDADDGDLLDRVEGLELLALVGLLDPPRPEVRDAIRVCRRAGVAVKMITGDHAVTASAIAADLGIEPLAVTGAELDAMDDATLADRVEEIGVFARVAPEHKVRIVKALRANGRIVAMTGDGVNDAPALKSADIGVAMGITGTEVTKEAASMVLTDDNFTTIVGAVEGGRTMYANLVKFVRSQLSTNFGAIFTLLGATVTGLPIPFTAIQVLWINIIMDGPPAMALGVDPPAKDAMSTPPRDPRARILTPRRLAGLVWLGAIGGAGTLGVLAYADAAWGTAVAVTMAFTTFVLFQVFNALNARSETRSVFRRESLTNRTLWIALGSVVVLQFLVVQLPVANGLLDTTALSGGQWLLCVTVASMGLLLEEARKVVAARMR